MKKPPVTSPGKAHDKPSRSGFFGSIIKTLVIFLLLRSLAVQTYVIPSGSMEDTLLIGDYLFAFPSAYSLNLPLLPGPLVNFAPPARGDIVVFRGHHERIDLVKRVVGVAGDTLQMDGAVLLRNGVTVHEPYVRPVAPETDFSSPWFDWQRSARPAGVAWAEPTRDTWGPVVVPEGHLFMLGDNRDSSLDSRFFGFVPRGAVRASVGFIYMSLGERRSAVPFFGRVRTERLGQRIR
jgi:signal peptidase I